MTIFFRPNCVSFFNCVACDAIYRMYETNFVVFPLPAISHECLNNLHIVNSFYGSYALFFLLLFLAGSHLKWHRFNIFSHYTLVWRLPIYYMFLYCRWCTREWHSVFRELSIVCVWNASIDALHTHFNAVFWFNGFRKCKINTMQATIYFSVSTPLLSTIKISIRLNWWDKF